MLYFIGGRPKTGKSKIARTIKERKSAILVPTDQIRGVIGCFISGVRGIYKVQEIYQQPGDFIAVEFVDVYQKTDNTLFFKIKAICQQPNEPKISTMEFPIEFSKDLGDQTPDERAWLFISGFIKAYDKFPNTHDILIEGVAVTPEGVNALKMYNLNKSAVFVGYSNESHWEIMRDYSKNNKDYLKDKDDDYFIQEVKNGIPLNNELKERSKKLGYPYFDISKLGDTFDNAIAEHLLKI